MGCSQTYRFGFISRLSVVLLVLLAASFPGCGKKRTEETAKTTTSVDSTTRTVSRPRDHAGPLAGITDPRMADPAYLSTLPPTAERDVAIGNAFFEKGSLDSALYYYRSATQRDSRSTVAWNYVGITYNRLERLNEAENAYKKAIAIDAFYPKTHSNLGNLYLKREMFDKAIAAFQRANSIDSTDTVNWMNMGLAYKKKGDLNGAIISYRKAATLAPDDPEPWSRLGYIYAEKMLYKAARESWGEAVARDSSRTDLLAHIQKLEAYAESTGTQ